MDSKIFLPTRSFRLRKSESLDWKKIASLDIERIIEQTDAETLKDILPQIAFCQPDAEFDHTKTDPGFRKVFKLGQLIIEHLIDSQEHVIEKATAAETKNASLMIQNKHCQQEIQKLREKLVEAKKELKRRKEIIESNQQQEILGKNKDECDQCPYCTKKFINSIYLLSHLQRRHQGLPIDPSLNFAGQLLNQPMKPVIQRASACTQTEDNEEGRADGGWKSLDHHTVNDLVEQYLKQRVGIGSSSDPTFNIPHLEQTQSNLSYVSEGQIQNVESQRITAVGMVDMKDELENQWRNLMEKMHKTEIEDLKSTLLEEMHNIQENILKSTAQIPRETVPPALNATTSSSSPGLAGRVEERFQKQEDEMENLKCNLQSKIRSDIRVIESRLESQERFWRAKLRLVEEEYQTHIMKLREEFQASLSQRHIPPIMTSPARPRVNWPSDPAMVNFKPPTPHTSTLEEESAVMHTSPPQTRPQPVPTPRRPPKPSPRSRVNASNIETESILAPHPKTAASPAKTAVVISNAHANGEPGDGNKENDNEYSSSFSESESSGSVEPSVAPVTVRQKMKMSPSHDESTSSISSRDDVNANILLVQPRNEVVQKLNQELKEIGIDPKARGLPKNYMNKSLKKLKKKRKSLTEKVDNYDQERKMLNQQSNEIAKAKILEGKAKSINETRRLSSRPNEDPANSPLVKMIRAVKNGGTSLKRRMSFISKKPKVKSAVISPRIRSRLAPAGGITPVPGPSRKSAPPPPPPVGLIKAKKKKPKIKTFFRRHWGKKDESESEEDRDTPPKKSRPIPRNVDLKALLTPTPKKKDKEVELSPRYASNRKPSVEQEPMPLIKFKEIYDEEQRIIANRKADIQRKAEKAIKLSTQAVISKISNNSPNKKHIHRSFSKEFDKAVFEAASMKFRDEVPRSSTIDGRREKIGKFSNSVSSLSELDSEGSETQGTDNVKKPEEDTEDHYVSLVNTKSPHPIPKRPHSPPPKPKIHSNLIGKPVTVIYGDNPTRNLNEFLVKPRPRPRAESSSEELSIHTSMSSAYEGKPLKRLQRNGSLGSNSSKGRKKGEASRIPVLRKSMYPPRKNDDTLNNPSDWDTSVSEIPPRASRKSDPSQGQANFVKKGQRIPAEIPQQGTPKHKEPKAPPPFSPSRPKGNSWDSDRN